MFEETANERYHRQLILPGFGGEKQRLLHDAKVLVIGAGGLGCPVLQALAGAGTGLIGIADDGLVELSNLQRQFLYTTADIGQPKTTCARRALQALNPDVSVQVHQSRVVAQNALALLQAYDIIVDGTDNFESRYMLADACALLGKPLVFGAVSRFDGQVALFHQKACYRDLFPVPPQPGEVQNCSEAGVLGFMPGLIGQLMAGECIKVITGLGRTLDGHLLSYASLENRFYEINISPSPEGRKALPVDAADFEQRDYALLCGTQQPTVQEISIDALRTCYEQEQPVLIDVRELHELPCPGQLIDLQLPLQQLLEQLPLVTGSMVVFICQSGKRSQRAAAAYQAAYPDMQVYSLKGGITALAQNNWVL